MHIINTKIRIQRILDDNDASKTDDVYLNSVISFKVNNNINDLTTTATIEIPRDISINKVKTEELEYTEYTGDKLVEKSIKSLDKVFITAYESESNRFDNRKYQFIGYIKSFNYNNDKRIITINCEDSAILFKQAFVSISLSGENTTFAEILNDIIDKVKKSLKSEFHKKEIDKLEIETPSIFTQDDLSRELFLLRREMNAYVNLNAYSENIQDFVIGKVRSEGFVTGIDIIDNLKRKYDLINFYFNQRYNIQDGHIQSLFYGNKFNTKYSNIIAIESYKYLDKFIVDDKQDKDYIVHKLIDFRLNSKSIDFKDELVVIASDTQNSSSGLNYRVVKDKDNTIVFTNDTNNDDIKEDKSNGIIDEVKQLDDFDKSKYDTNKYLIEINVPTDYESLLNFAIDKYNMNLNKSNEFTVKVTGTPIAQPNDILVSYYPSVEGSDGYISKDKYLIESVITRMNQSEGFTQEIKTGRKFI